jgi:hypothetical protein
VQNFPNAGNKLSARDPDRAHDLGPAHVPKVSLVEMNADKLIESAVNRGREGGERERLNGKTKFLT